MFKSLSLYLIRLSFFIYIILLSFPVSAQQRDLVSGVVISQDKSEPIDGVTISWSNKGIGSITNADGKFIILLSPPYNQQDSLIFSCIGYKAQKVSISAVINNKNLVVKLEASIQNLNEVVIRPLTLKQLLDSIDRHNSMAFVSPMKLDGYYRELVFTNTKCTEYSDAICSYFFDRTSKPDGQLKINASRCRLEKKDNEDKNNLEIYHDSEIDPNLAFKYAMLSTMLVKFFPDKVLDDYKYAIERSVDQASDELKITISPNIGSTYFYKLTLIVKTDFTIRSYRLEIPDNLSINIKEKSLLGIHFKNIQLIINVNYSSLFDHIYPAYYSVHRKHHIWGKFLGTTMDQIVENKSEFVVAEVNKQKDLSAFNKQDIYKKGNICNNGIAINDTLLKKYTIIVPSAKDSIAIKALTQQ
jgi:hypothetical protein